MLNIDNANCPVIPGTIQQHNTNSRQVNNTQTASISTTLQQTINKSTNKLKNIIKRLLLAIRQRFYHHDEPLNISYDSQLNNYYYNNQDNFIYLLNEQISSNPEEREFINCLRQLKNFLPFLSYDNKIKVYHMLHSIPPAYSDENPYILPPAYSNQDPFPPPAYPKLELYFEQNTPPMSPEYKTHSHTITTV